MRFLVLLFSFVSVSLCASTTFEIQYYFPHKNCTGDAWEAWGYAYSQGTCENYTSGCQTNSGLYIECINPEDVESQLAAKFPSGYVGYATYSSEHCPGADITKVYAYTTTCSPCELDSYYSSYAVGECATKGNYTAVYEYVCDNSTCDIEDTSHCDSYSLGYVFGGGCFSSTGFSSQVLGQCNTADSVTGESMEYMILEFYDQDNSCAGNVAWLDAYFDDDDCSYYNTVECDGGSYEYTCVSDLNDLDIDGMYPDGYIAWARYSDNTCTTMSAIEAYPIGCTGFAYHDDYVIGSCESFSSVIGLYEYECDSDNCDLSGCDKALIGTGGTAVNKCSVISDTESEMIFGTCIDIGSDQNSYAKNSNSASSSLVTTSFFFVTIIMFLLL